MNSSNFRVKSVVMAGLLACAPWLAQAEVVPLDSVVAIVNDDIIMESELDTRIDKIIERLRERDTAVPPPSVIRERVLEQMVLESIQLQLAEQDGIRISDNQLNQTMEQLAARNGLDLDSFQAALEAEGVSYLEAREQIRRELVVSRVQQRRVDQRIRVSKKDIEAYLNSADGRSATAAEYELGHILIAFSSGADKAEIAEAKAKASALYEELKGGADFTEYAVAHSDGRNALEGGNLGWRKEDQLPSIFADDVPGLKVGEVSTPIQSGSGFHLIKLLDKKGGGVQMVTQTKVRHILVSPNEIRSEAEAKEILETVRERIMEGEDFSELAKAYTDDTASAFDGGDLDWVLPGQMVPEFEDVMNHIEPGQLSEPFKSQFGWHILQVMERRDEDMGDELQETRARQVLHRRRYEEELQTWLRDIKEESYIEYKEDADV